MSTLYNLQDITLLTFVRLDNEERIKNLRAMHGFYRKHCENYTHIIVEDDKIPKVPAHLDLHEDDVYVYTRSDTEWNKCEGYNKGIKLSKTNIITLNDVDAIIHPDQLLEAKNILSNDPEAGMIYPFNGLFLCADVHLKNKFIEDCDYSILDAMFPQELNEYDGNVGSELEVYHQHVNKTYNDVLVGHVASKGGCVMGRRDNLIRCNGYNPRFKGWGYEDDEMPLRVNNLGYGVGRLPGVRKPCWHLHHFDGTGSAKETQEFHEHNRQECARVEKCTRDELQQYITQWRL